MDCAHPLVFNNGAHISYASFIMSAYDEHTKSWKWNISPTLFNGNGWANTSLIQAEPFEHRKVIIYNMFHFITGAFQGMRSKVSVKFATLNSFNKAGGWGSRIKLVKIEIQDGFLHKTSIFTLTKQMTHENQNLLVFV